MPASRNSSATTDTFPEDGGNRDALKYADSTGTIKKRARKSTNPPWPNSVAARRAGAADGGRGIARMMHAKLWENPCWLAFRVNYLALRYNTPLYGWVGKTRGLSRVEYVVIYSLGLADGTQARDISESSGFPKNTLSRAIAKLEKHGHIVREHHPGGGRNQPLRLSKSGQALFDETVPVFERFEKMMLSTLTPQEQKTLADLLAKVVLAADTRPETLIDPDRDL